MRTAWLALLLLSFPAYAWEDNDKYLMTSLVVMQVIDIKQTDKALRHGGIEKNPTYGGEHPSLTRLAAYKTVGTGFIYWLADTNEASRTEVLIAANIVQFFVIRQNYFFVEFGF